MTKTKGIDHTAIVNELALVLRGAHPAWEGDRRANGYRFLTRLADDMPEDAAALSQDITRNVSDFASETGISPSTLRLAAAVLSGARQGSL